MGSERSQQQPLLPNRGEILEFNRQVVPLSRPLFDGFGLDVSSEKGQKESAGSIEVDVTSQVQKPSKAKLTSKKMSHAVVERLPNGWSKKAVKRLTGIAKGKWETYLITPDQKILKNPGDLKLYIAKSGAVVDSNLVNFSLPKRTAKVDKMLSNSQKKKQATKQEMEIDDDIAISVSGSSPQKAKSPLKAKNDENMELDHSRFSTEDDQAQFAEFVKKSNNSGHQGAGSAKRNRNVIVLPKSSRREVKVPLKYRDLEEDDEQTSSTPSKQPNLLSKPQKQGPKTNTSPATKKAAMKAVAALLQAEPEPELILPEQQEQVIMPFKAQELIDQHNLTFAVKSVASKTGQAQANALNEEINEKGEKIVECEQCGVKVVKRNLNRHILTVHEKVKTYSCPNCMMLFGAKQVVERHFNKVCKWSLEDIAVDNLDEIDEIELPTSPVSPEELQAAIIQETTMAVAVKSEIVPTKKVQQKSIEELSSLGVGTFSIDKDTAKNMASGRFVKRIKIKRCGKCKECKSSNCQKCEPCRDML